MCPNTILDSELIGVCLSIKTLPQLNNSNLPLSRYLASVSERLWFGSVTWKNRLVAPRIAASSCAVAREQSIFCALLIVAVTTAEQITKKSAVLRSFIRKSPKEGDAFRAPFSHSKHKTITRYDVLYKAKQGLRLEL